MTIQPKIRETGQARAEPRGQGPRDIIALQLQIPQIRQFQEFVRRKGRHQSIHVESQGAQVRESTNLRGEAARNASVVQIETH